MVFVMQVGVLFCQCKGREWQSGGESSSFSSSMVFSFLKWLCNIVQVQNLVSCLVNGSKGGFLWMVIWHRHPLICFESFPGRMCFSPCPVREASLQHRQLGWVAAIGLQAPSELSAHTQSLCGSVLRETILHGFTLVALYFSCGSLCIS